MENNKVMADKKKLLPIILAAAVILIVIIVIAMTANKKTEEPTGVLTPGSEESAENEMEPGVVDEAGELGDAAEMETVNPVLVDAVRVIEGANLISSEGVVVTDTGEEVRTDVSPMSAEAPRQTLPVEREALEGKAIMLDVTASGFSPAEFTVKKGEAITIALTSADQWSHNIKFSDPSLQSAGIAVSAGTTRAVTFNAPDAAGEYPFSCDIPGHAARGEVGKMIVE